MQPILITRTRCQQCHQDLCRKVFDVGRRFQSLDALKNQRQQKSVWEALHVNGRVFAIIQGLLRGKQCGVRLLANGSQWQV